MTARRVLFRCDAGSIPGIGTGHLARDLLVAEHLAARGGAVGFCGRYDASARQRIAESGYELIVATEDEPEAELLARAVLRHAPEILVLDRLDTDAEDLAPIRSTVLIVATLDDRGTGATHADLVINAMVDSAVPALTGFDYAIVPPPQPVNNGNGRRQVVVTLGCFDARGLGPRLVCALGEGVDAHVSWIVSSTPQHVPRVTSNVQLVERPPDFSQRLRSATVAVVNGGLTLIEAVANGVPSVAVAQYEHQTATIARLVRRGAVVGVDTSGGDACARVVSAVRTLLNDAKQRETLSRHAFAAVDGLGLSRVSDLLTVVDRLPWDSEFFGIEIARIYPQRLTERILAFALREVERLGSRCVYYLCDCHHAESVRLAERAGFSFVDIRVTLDRPATGGCSDPELRDAITSDLPGLQAIARSAYEHSRYFFDHQFSRADCERFYGDWLTKCASRQLADATFVLPDERNDPLGYIAVKHKTPATAAIVLLGVSPLARGKGTACRLIDHAVAWAGARGATHIEVVTQSRNYDAQRAYQRAGFITAKSELWYHFWPH